MFRTKQKNHQNPTSGGLQLDLLISYLTDINPTQQTGKSQYRGWIL